MRFITKQSIIISFCLILFAITAICIRVGNQDDTTVKYVVGGAIKPSSENKDLSSYDTSLSRQTISILNKKKFNYNEIYFRPSKSDALNNNFMASNDFTETFKDGSIPVSLTDSPLNTLINYFSVLQQASNLDENKTGVSAGYGIKPFPIAYEFLSQNNKKSMTYDEYLASFQGIGHLNLIKVIPISTQDTDKYKYFIELEVLESGSMGATAFNYYTGEMTIVDIDKTFYIDSLYLTPEDFFRTDYHGWYYDAESYVENVFGSWNGLIMKQYSPKISENTKEITIDGTDGEKYMFRFARLTNGTDLLINSFIKTRNNWVPIFIDTNQDVQK